MILVFLLSLNHFLQHVFDIKVENILVYCLFLLLRPHSCDVKIFSFPRVGHDFKNQTYNLLDHTLYQTIDFIDPICDKNLMIYFYDAIKIISLTFLGTPRPLLLFHRRLIVRIGIVWNYLISDDLIINRLK